MSLLKIVSAKHFSYSDLVKIELSQVLGISVNPCPLNGKDKRIYREIKIERIIFKLTAKIFLFFEWLIIYKF